MSNVDDFALTFDVSPAGWLPHKVAGLVRRRHFVSGRGPLKALPTEPPVLPGDRWVVVRTRLAGICGSDLAAITLSNHPASLLTAYTSRPMVLGHENVVEIESLGPAVTGWSVGQRVLVEPTLACAARELPLCRSCAAGRFGVCENVAEPGPCNLPPGVSTGYNARTGGSFSARFVAHESQLVAVPDALADASDERLILVDPLACCVHGIARNMPTDDEHVAVVGGGTIGLGTIACLRAMGFDGELSAFVRHEHQAAMATRFGASRVFRLFRKASKRERYLAAIDACGLPSTRLRAAKLGTLTFAGGFDTIFDAVGSRQSVRDSLAFATAGGRVVLLGTFDFGDLDLTPTWFREVTLVGSYGRGMDRVPAWDDIRGDSPVSSYEAVLELMAAGRLEADAMLTHVKPAREWRDALAIALAAGRHNAVKVAMDWL